MTLNSTAYRRIKMDRRNFVYVGAVTAVTAASSFSGTNVIASAAVADSFIRNPAIRQSSYGPIYRSPPASFANIKDFPYAPQYALIDASGLLMHYVDVGRRNGPVVLLAHGNPAWSYMYRKWIPTLVEQGYRVIAPDLIGFGRSDKLERHHYPYQRLNLKDITLYAQDWGGLTYLRVVSALPDRFARVVISNTGLPDENDPYTEQFITWQEQISQTITAFGPFIDQTTIRELSTEEEAAFDAPWPEEQLRGAPREMPLQVPGNGKVADQGAANRAAREFFSSSWTKPMLTLWSDVDNVISETAGLGFFRDQVPGAKGLPHKTYTAGHFIQEEEIAPQLVAEIISLIESTR
jgi:haloalkane dehalogenase